MIKKKNVSYIAFLMAVSLVLSGCGGTKEEIPELLEPVIKNESFRQVEYGSIGRSTIKIANVLPEEYCHFVKFATGISEITVDLGDYVEEGTVLAMVDLNGYQTEIDKKNAEIACKQSVIHYKEKICQQQIKEQKYKQKACKESGDTKGVKECETQIRMIEENERYDKLLCHRQVTILKEEVQELKEYTEDGVIKARHSGYVTYIKDVSETDIVESMENIVIVSDYNKLHLELAEDLSSSLYVDINELYSNIYIEVNGKKQAVEIYPYTTNQLVAIQGSGLYPNIRLELKETVSDMQPGDKIPVYFRSGTGKEVLKIGKDSLYQVGEQDFVYVKKGEKKEKREVTIGAGNRTDVEILSGLEEGEWVFYSSNSAMPEEYETYEVKAGNFNVQVQDKELKYQYTYTQIHTYRQENPALVKSVNVDKGTSVKKGDLICVLATGEGNAKIKEIRNSISNLRIDYERSKKEYEKQITALMKQIKNKQKNKKTEVKQPENKKAEPQVDVSADNMGMGAFGTQTTESMGGDNEDTTQAPTTENQAVITTEASTEDIQKEINTDTEKPADSKKQKTEDAASSDEYMAEQLECQKNVLIYEKSILEAEYKCNQTLLQKDYEQIADGNDETGKLPIYAEHDGIIGKLNICEGKKIVPETDSVLFQINDEASKKLIIDTGKEYIGVGSDTLFTYKSDASKKYAGKVVGNSAMVDKVYLSEKNDKSYVTNSYSEAGRNKIYIVIEDKQFYENQEGCNVAYSSVRIQKALVLPNYMIYTEQSMESPSVIYHYVWKVVDGILVKQYIEVDEDLMTTTETCILEGLQDGDVLAQQKLKEE